MAGIPVQPDGWPRPKGYANGMRARGELLAVAGQIGWDASGKLVAGGFTGQFEQALKNVAAVVAAAGGKPEDVISMTVFVASRYEYTVALPKVGLAWKAIFGRHYPAMALVEAQLLEPGAVVEIQALAVLEVERDE